MSSGGAGERRRRMPRCHAVQHAECRLLRAAMAPVTSSTVRPPSGAHRFHHSGRLVIESWKHGRMETLLVPVTAAGDQEWPGVGGGQQRRAAPCGGWAWVLGGSTSA